MEHTWDSICVLGAGNALEDASQNKHGLVGPDAGYGAWERRAVQGNRGSRVVRLVAVLDDLLA